MANTNCRTALGSSNSTLAWPMNSKVKLPQQQAMVHRHAFQVLGSFGLLHATSKRKGGLLYRKASVRSHSALAREHMRKATHKHTSVCCPWQQIPDRFGCEYKLLVLDEPIFKLSPLPSATAERLAALAPSRSKPLSCRWPHLARSCQREIAMCGSFITRMSTKSGRGWPNNTHSAAIVRLHLYASTQPK